MPLSPEKIRSRREQLGLSQTDAALLAKMPVQNWNRVESGERSDPRLSSAQRIAFALRCRLESLLD